MHLLHPHVGDLQDDKFPVRETRWAVTTRHPYFIISNKKVMTTLRLLFFTAFFIYFTSCQNTKVHASSHYCFKNFLVIICPRFFRVTKYILAGSFFTSIIISCFE